MSISILLSYVQAKLRNNDLKANIHYIISLWIKTFSYTHTVYLVKMVAVPKGAEPLFLRKLVKEVREPWFPTK